MQRLISMALAAISMLLMFAASAVHALPTIEGFDLVSSSRATRTSTDFVYRVRLRADSRSYTGVTITFRSTASSTQIIDGTVNIDSLDAAQFIRPLDTITIRQDRTVPFDRAVLVPSFVATVTGIGGGVTPLRVGPLEFLEPGGRPQHEAIFPIQGVAPVAGTTLGMAVDIYGDVTNAQYRFLGSSGQVIAEGPLQRSPPDVPSSPRFVAAVLIPTIPFTVEISANDLAGPNVKWQSTLYRPTEAKLGLFVSTLVDKTEVIPVTVRLESLTATGSYTVKLFLPLGFSGDTGPWNLNATPGQTAEVSTSVTVPAVGSDLLFQTITADAVPNGLSLSPISASINVIVR